MRIFGIDPGTATTGYGVIEASGLLTEKPFVLIEYGCIVTPKEMDMPLRLLSIQNDLHTLLELHKPDYVSIEQLFFGVNSRTAMTVGQARGVVLAAVAHYGIPIFEYQGLHVKHTLTGSGKADKKDVQKAVMKFLGKRKLAKPKSGFIDDAADALGVAICHYIKVSNGSGVSKVENVSTSRNTKVSKKKRVVAKQVKNKNGKKPIKGNAKRGR